MLAALSVFVQDIQHAVNLTITGLLFLSPVFYPISAIPEQLALVVLANPITIVIESVRDVAFWGTIPDLEFLLWYSIVALLILILGFSWFQKTRDGFSDVL